MSRIETSRLKLSVESDDELIDQFEYNWPILDKYAGGLLVNDGVTPPDNELYEGCVVQEVTSGKMWMAMKDPNTGAFVKSWLIYPWSIAVNTGGVSIPVAAPGATRGFTTLMTADCINSSAADLNGSGHVKIPIDGIYTLNFVNHHVSDPDNAYCTYMVINGTATDRHMVIARTTTAATYMASTSGNEKLKANDTIGYRTDLFGNQNIMSLWLWVSLLSPL